MIILHNTWMKTDSQNISHSRSLVIYVIVYTNTASFNVSLLLVHTPPCHQHTIIPVYIWSQNDGSACTTRLFRVFYFWRWKFENSVASVLHKLMKDNLILLLCYTQIIYIICSFVITYCFVHIFVLTSYYVVNMFPASTRRWSYVWFYVGTILGYAINTILQ